MAFKQYNKKGQVGGAVSSIIQLVVGVGVATLVLIFVGTLGGQTYQLTEEKINLIGDYTVTNQSITLINNTPVSLGHYDIHTGSLVMFNSTGGKVALNNVILSNIDYDLGKLTLSPTGNFSSLTVLANYKYGAIEVQSAIKDSIIKSFQTLETTADYEPIIVLAVVISLVMFLVLGFTNMGGQGRGGAL